MTRTLIAAVVGGLLIAGCQDPEAAKKIEALENRVAELEKKAAAGPAAGKAAPGQAAATGPEEQAAAEGEEDGGGPADHKHGGRRHSEIGVCCLGSVGLA